MRTKEQTASDETLEKLIGEVTATVVEGINQLEAESWIRIGERVFNYVKDMKARFGDTKDWYVELGEHPESLHKSTMLRCYAKSWQIFQDFSEETRSLVNKRGITSSHLAQVLSPRYTQEDREILLKYAADEGLSVRKYKAYLKGKGRESSFMDYAAADALPKDAASDCHVTTPVPCLSGNPVSVVRSHDGSDLLSSLKKSYSRMVGYKVSLGEQGISPDITMAIGEIIRFAVAQGMVSREELQALMDVETIPVDFAALNGLRKATRDS